MNRDLYHDQCFILMLYDVFLLVFPKQLFSDMLLFYERLSDFDNGMAREQ